MPVPGADDADFPRSCHREELDLRRLCADLHWRLTQRARTRAAASYWPVRGRRRAAHCAGEQVHGGTGGQWDKSLSDKSLGVTRTDIV